MLNVTSRLDRAERRAEREVKRLNRDERRDSILDVARECFLRDGYAGCSMSTIAATLGGSKGTLYNYFRSKEELFDAFVRRTCARFAEAMSGAPPIETDLREHLVHLARAFLDHLMSGDAIAVQRLVIGEGGRFPELGRIFYEAGPLVFMERMSAELSPLIDAGVLRRADPKQMSFHFKDLVLSGLYQPTIWGVCETPTAIEKDIQAKLGVDTFLRAYRPN
ncbi:MAG TPA: TetR/AcrR family transcriptional regulator [Caulobacteraceae bacterium]|nr:TetR/AcrR family transcriptional regulator [Caulobacteraceae bacterium]